MHIVEVVNQDNEPTEPVTSVTTHLRDTPNNYGAETGSKGLIVRRAPRLLTQLLISQFNYTPCLFLHSKSASLSHFYIRRHALGFCEGVEDLGHFLVVVGVEVGAEAGFVEQAVVLGAEADDFCLLVEVVDEGEEEVSLQAADV